MSFCRNSERNTVRGNNSGTGERSAICRRHADTVAAIFEAGHHGVGQQFYFVVVPACIEQDVMQIDAMNDDVRVFEPGAKRSAGRNADQLLAGQRIDHQNRRRRIGHGQNLLHQAQAIQDVKNIWAELDAVADGAELRCSFKTRAGLPWRASASAVVSPPSPPPTMMIGSLSTSTQD